MCRTLMINVMNVTTEMPGNNNVYCTTNLDQDSWETAKS